MEGDNIVETVYGTAFLKLITTIDYQHTPASSSSPTNTEEPIWKHPNPFTESYFGSSTSLTRKVLQQVPSPSYERIAGARRLRRGGGQAGHVISAGSGSGYGLYGGPGGHASFQ